MIFIIQGTVCSPSQRFNWQEDKNYTMCIKNVISTILPYNSLRPDCNGIYRKSIPWDISTAYEGKHVLKQVNWDDSITHCPLCMSNFPDSCLWKNRSPPFRYSITKNKWVWKKDYHKFIQWIMKRKRCDFTFMSKSE